MPKPSDFFVGVLDFFAILLPGAIATAMLSPRVGPWVLGPLIDKPSSEAVGWAMFLTAAYFLGHLIFLVGSWIDRFYNALRERFNPYRQRERLSVRHADSQQLGRSFGAKSAQHLPVVPRGAAGQMPRSG